MKLTPDVHKSQLLDGLEWARSDLLVEVSSLLPEKRIELFLGAWNAYDLVAHLIGWDFTNIQAAQDILTDQLPQFYAHHDRDWQTYNAKLVREYAQGNWDDLLAAAADSHRQLMSFLREIPAEEFDHDRGIRFRGWKVTIGRLLQAEAEDEATHTQQVAAFKEQIDHQAVP